MRRRGSRWGAWAGLACLLLCIGCDPDAPPPPGTGLDLGSVLGGTPPEGFLRAVRPRRFTFPRDHGPHPDYATEWWYVTGNLENDEGRRFGYQLALFRIGLKPGPPRRTSRWATHQVYMGHLALTNPGAGKFTFYERLARGNLDLAGAVGSPPRVWVEDWSINMSEDMPWRLRAGHKAIALDLTLEPARPVVLQGEQGLSRKGARPGNASYYYSIPRLDTRGTLRAGDRTYRVTGLSWLDREWGTSALEPGQVGWDWFSLQLSDGYDLMFYRLRRGDGSADPHSRGTLTDREGRPTTLTPADLKLEVLDTWRSPRGGRYPARWRLRVPSLQLDLEIMPILADQELDASVRYWEGAVDVAGRHAGKKVQGRGYVELTGYAHGPPHTDTSISSISKINVALGGMMLPAPLAP